MSRISLLVIRAPSTRCRPRVQLVNLVALLAAWVTVFDTIAKEREMLERPEQDVYGGMEQGVAQGIPVRSWLPAVPACTPTAACCLDVQVEQGRKGHDLITTTHASSKPAVSQRNVVAAAITHNTVRQVPPPSRTGAGVTMGARLFSS